jgi:hypothetical protein
MTIKAIETSYRGYRFRSRLEARWAVFFDAVGINWEYEAEGYILPDGTHYLPDFYVWGSCYDRGYFLEIKPERDLTEHEMTIREMFGSNIPKGKGYAVFSGVPGTGLAADHIAMMYSPQGISISILAIQIAIDSARSARFEHGESGGQ